MQKNEKKMVFVGHIGRVCPECGREWYLGLTKEQQEEYGRYQDACSFGRPSDRKSLTTFNRTEREFIRTKHCPDCQTGFLKKKQLTVPHKWICLKDLEGICRRQGEFCIDMEHASDHSESSVSDMIAVANSSKWQHAVSVDERIAYMYRMEMDVRGAAVTSDGEFLMMK